MSLYKRCFCGYFTELPSKAILFQPFLDSRLEAMAEIYRISVGRCASISAENSKKFIVRRSIMKFQS